MDPDPATQNDADSSGSGSATLLSRYLVFCIVFYILDFPLYTLLAGHLLVPLLDTCALFSVSDKQAMNDVTENMVFPLHNILSTEK